MSLFFIVIATLLVDIVLPSYPGMSCYSDGGYINDYDDPINNIQSNYFLSGVVSSVHHNHHEDRKWKFNYCKPPTTAFISQGSLSTTPYDDAWTRDCNTINANAAMIGATSSHSNNKEDRQWVWYCGVLDSSKYYLTGCTNTGYLNGYDDTFGYYCPNNGVIRRVYSVHDNDNEDRRWGFYCCRVTDIPTQSPTHDPTPTPTDNPTHDPTTPAPTDPGTIICGDIDVGAYNNVPVDFVVRMPYKGDLTFDASNSNFNITSLAAVFGTTPQGFINDNKLTLSNIEVIGDYKFTLTGDTTGTYDVRIYCQSDTPTRSPTRSPTPAPTNYPSGSPTMEPTGEPTMEPTWEPSRYPSLEPTLAPSLSPIPAPTNAPHPKIIIGKPTEPVGGEVTEAPETTDADNDPKGNGKSKSLVGDTDNLLLLYIGVGIGIFVACCIVCCFLLIFKLKTRKNNLKDIQDKIVPQSPMSITGGTVTVATGETGGENTAGNIEMTDGYTKGNDTNNGYENDNELPQLPNDNEEQEENVDGLYNHTNVNSAVGMLVNDINRTNIQTIGADDDDDSPDENYGMYQKNNTNTKGITNGMCRLCSECGKSIEQSNGQIDENDGNFYCNDCWNSFYE